MKKYLMFIALAAISFAASAGNYGASAGLSTYTGASNGYTSTVSTGGSQATAEAVGTGKASQKSRGESNGAAYATGYTSPTAAESASGFTSYSASYADGFKTGTANGTSSAGGGTDVSAGAASSYAVKKFGASGFVGFSGW